MAGSTDSEVMFHLALSLGFAASPVAAVERMAGFVESVAAAHAVPAPLQMTVATTGGERVWCFRYASEGQALHPGNEVLLGLSDETRLVVSEPLGDLEGAWQPMPESSYGIIGEGRRRAGPVPADRAVMSPVRRRARTQACRTAAASGSFGR